MSVLGTLVWRAGRWKGVRVGSRGPFQGSGIMRGDLFGRGSSQSIVLFVFVCLFESVDYCETWQIENF